MSPLHRAACWAWMKAERNFLLLIYIAVAVTVILAVTL